MTELDRVKGIVNAYIAAVHELMRRKPWSDGLLGLGKLPGRDAVHERYYALLREEIAVAAGSGLAEQEVFAICAFLLRAEKELGASPMIRTMLIAFQCLTASLIPLLTQKHREELLHYLETSCPPQRRLPCQNEIIKLLR